MSKEHSMQALLSKEGCIPMEKQIIYGEERITVYSIGYLAYMTHRSQATIRRWQRRKILPAPLFDLNDGRRWYSAPELLGYTYIVRQGNIRAGAAIPKQVCLQFREFKHRLKKIVQGKPETLGKELPRDFSLRDLMRRHKTEFWKSNTLKLVRQLSEI